MLGKGTFVIDLDFKPRGVCARMIHVELSDDGSTIENVAFDGGCNGNLKAIGRLVAGQPVDSIVELLQGNTCGPRKTSWCRSTHACFARSTAKVRA